VTPACDSRKARGQYSRCFIRQLKAATMLNPRPTIQVESMGGGQHIVIVDDFLLQPEKMVDFARAHRDDFSNGNHNFFPGPEMLLPDQVTQAIGEFVTRHVRAPLGLRRTTMLGSRLSIATLKPEQLQNMQRICHSDVETSRLGGGTGAMVLSLFKDPRLGGTSFFRSTTTPEAHRKMRAQAASLDRAAFAELVGAGPGYAIGSDNFHQLVYTSTPAFNRAIFYDGTLLHSGNIHSPELLVDDVDTGRLTINAFFDMRYKAK
jgi:hypothetical protein